MRAARISPSPAIGMAFLGFCAPPVYCNGRLRPSAVPRPRSSSSYPVCALPLRIASIPSFDWRHVQGGPVARLPHRASPSHLPGVFHPGDTHGIFPFRGLTSSRAGSPLDDPCPSFPWLDTLPCRAGWSRSPCYCGSGSDRRSHRFVPGFRTRVVLLSTPGFPAMRPLRCVFTRQGRGADQTLQLRGLPGTSGRPERSQTSRRKSQTLPRTSEGRAWHQRVVQPLAQHAVDRLRTRSRHRVRSPFLPPTTLSFRHVAAGLLERTGIQGLKPGSKRASPGRF